MKKQLLAVLVLATPGFVRADILTSVKDFFTGNPAPKTTEPVRHDFFQSTPRSSATSAKKSFSTPDAIRHWNKALDVLESRGSGASQNDIAWAKHYLERAKGKTVTPYSFGNTSDRIARWNKVIAGFEKSGSRATNEEISWAKNNLKRAEQSLGKPKTSTARKVTRAAAPAVLASRAKTRSTAMKPAVTRARKQLTPAQKRKATLARKEKAQKVYDNIMANKKKESKSLTPAQKRQATLKLKAKATEAYDKIMAKK